MTQDRCPGVLRPHQAADGVMVRVRVPGGQTTGTALAALGRVAHRFGSGLLQLTSRASLQLRGLPEVLPEEFERAVAGAGFLPSATHERVRNIVCSPLTGLAAGRADLRPLVVELDAAIRAESELADLSGRFLFGLDDGRGDVLGLQPDLAYRADGPDRGLLLVGGDRGVGVAARQAVPSMVALARAFVRAAADSAAWRVSDLPGWVAGLPDLQRVGPPPAQTMPLGAVGAHASVAVPLGLLTPSQVAAVAGVAGGGPVVLTPWRGLVVSDAADRLDTLAAAGLVTDPDSAWTSLSACVGAPWCANGQVDTQALVRSVADLDLRWPRTHVSGCERRCGAPVTPHLDLVAPTRADLLVAARTDLLAAGRAELVTHG